MPNVTLNSDCFASSAALLRVHLYLQHLLPSLLSFVKSISLCPQSDHQHSMKEIKIIIMISWNLKLNYWFFGTDSNDKKQIEDVEQERGAALSFSGPRQTDGRTDRQMDRQTQ